jgi:ATP/maltotriose-dependent transcriptional regulator MalT
VQESVTIFTELGEPWSRGRALVTMGWVVHAEGQEREARTWFEQAVNLGRATQLDPLRLNAQFGLASLMQEAAPAAALVRLEQIITHSATDQPTRARAIALRQALLSANSSSSTAAPHEAAGTHIRETGETLTPREVEVLHLLAQGCSNQAIAAQLIVAVGTVKRHVNSILGKLHAQSRFEAVARARALGLV